MSLDGSIRWRGAGLLSALWHNAQKCSIFMWLVRKQRLQGISKLPSGLVLLCGFTSIQPHVPTPHRLYLFSLESHKTPGNSPRKEHTTFSSSTTVALCLAHNCTQQRLPDVVNESLLSQLHLAVGPSLFSHIGDLELPLQRAHSVCLFI